MTKPLRSPCSGAAFFDEVRRQHRIESADSGECMSPVHSADSPTLREANSFLGWRYDTKSSSSVCRIGRNSIQRRERRVQTRERRGYPSSVLCALLFLLCALCVQFSVQTAHGIRRDGITPTE